VTLRRLGGALLALAAGIGILVLVVVVFGSRDKSTFHEATGPGRVHPDQGSRHLARGASRAGFHYETDPPTSGPHVVTRIPRDDRELSTDEVLTALEQGDVVLVYRNPALRSGLRALQRDVAGPFDPDVAASGQAIVLARKPRGSGAPITAIAWRHSLNTSSVDAPELRDFIEFWLGRSAGA
jgi:hypothetical protein